MHVGFRPVRILFELILASKKIANNKEIAMFKRKRRVQASQNSGPDMDIDVLVARMPCLGEDSLLPALDRLPPRPVMESLEYLRRVMISWLIGRPVSKIAERVGCSQRTAQNVIRKVIYASEDHLARSWIRWSEIGLIGAIDSPIELIAKYEGHQSILGPETLVLVVCQVCHRVAGAVPFLDNSGRRNDGAPIAYERLPSGLLVGEADVDIRLVRIQGHLLCHFPLGDDPLPLRYRQSQHRFNVAFAKLGLMTTREVMSSWRHHYSESVSPKALEVLQEFRSQDPRSLLPVVDGKLFTLEKARRRWRQMLG